MGFLEKPEVWLPYPQEYDICPGVGKMNKALLGIALAVGLASGFVGSATANSAATTAVMESVGANGPASFRMFCAVNPTECRPGGSSSIKLTDASVRTLTEVNAGVNRSIRPRLDSAALQLWRINPAAGDCKSYVVSKRHELIKRGIPASALRIAVVRTADGTGHAVLVVKTDKGDLTLDNLSTEIKPLRETGYRVVAISQADPRRWS